MDLALHEKHTSLQAKMINFFGWQMPLYYDSIIAEHLAVRNEVGIFDVSHMGNFMLSGEDAYSAINYLISNNLSKINPGSAIYSPLLYENGTFVDDIIVYYESETTFYLIVNASNIEKDFTWIKENLQKNSFKAELNNLSEEFSLLAIQGKNSAKYINEIFPQLTITKPFTFEKIQQNNASIIVANTGYTGEKGVEVLVPNTIVDDFYEKCLVANIKPCGLGARDSLRIEKGYSLYGNEINENYNALEAGLGWTISFDKDFIGKSALLEYREQSSEEKKKITGFIMEEKAFARTYHEIYNENDNALGEVTSGCFSPSLKKNIGLGYIPKNYAAKKIKIKIRDKFYKADITKRVFL